MGIDPTTDLNFLANYLVQVLSAPPHLGASMNLGDFINVVGQQHNYITIPEPEGAHLEVLKNIFQMLNTNSNNITCSSSLGFCQVPSYVGATQATLVKTDDNTPRLSLRLDVDHCYTQSLNKKSAMYETLDENTLPLVVDSSLAAMNVNQLESNTNSTYGSFTALTTVTGDFLEGWEKLADDGNDLWKGFLK